ncbi:NAD-dependent protein deacetylase sirtuin-2 [Mortierella alpina]|nr:NAD-dependent protein deacetylase sirtuin-2 [Mortierella alpina]
MATPRIPVKARSTRAKPDPELRVRILKDNTLESVAEFINETKPKNIIVMTGAGISTAAGIKDFRSPGTGLYDDLERFNLPYPEAVFDISFFKDNPSPFYRLAKELLPGRYRPTLTHYLLPLLAKKGLLLRSYTQNIDMLERLTGLDAELLVEAHGSFATSECIECEEVIDNVWVRKHILKGEIPHCESCGGLVKPTITFFGEMLPDRFGDLSQEDFEKCDLLLVLGTSLQVEPFNRLITKVPPNCPRLLINRDKVGEDMHSGFDFDDKWKYTFQRDAVFLGNCDDGTRKLAQLCGWEGELQAMFEAGNIEMQLAEELEALELAKEQHLEEEEAERKQSSQPQTEEKSVAEKAVEEEEASLEFKAKHDLHLLDSKISLATHNTPSSAVDEITYLLQSSSITAVDHEASETIVIVQESLSTVETTQDDDTKDKPDTLKESIKVSDEI